jgi:uncharacterized protein YeaO (DUF488 family)
MSVSIKGVYAKPTLADGARVLITRAWPRGLGKEAARVDLWAPDLAPSDALSAWMKSHSANPSALRRRYFADISAPAASQQLDHIHNLLESKETLTLLVNGDIEKSGAAVFLKELLEGVRKPPSNSGPAPAAAAGRARASRRPRS